MSYFAFLCNTCQWGEMYKTYSELKDLEVTLKNFSFVCKEPVKTLNDLNGSVGCPTFPSPFKLMSPHKLKWPITMYIIAPLQVV